MRAKPFISTFSAWIALFAILCHALMPSLAQARLLPALQLPVEMCSVAGRPGQVVLLEDGKSTPLKKFEPVHCLFCLASSPAAGLPPPMPAQILELALTSPDLPAVCTPRVKSCKQTAAPPRGPPSLA